jgi:hypothetical protein
MLLGFGFEITCPPPSDETAIGIALGTRDVTNDIGQNQGVVKVFWRRTDRPAMIWFTVRFYNGERLHQDQIGLWPTRSTRSELQSSIQDLLLRAALAVGAQGTVSSGSVYKKETQVGRVQVIPGPMRLATVDDPLLTRIEQDQVAVAVDRHQVLNALIADLGAGSSAG